MNENRTQFFLSYIISSAITVVLQVVCLLAGGYLTSFQWKPIALLFTGSFIAWWLIVTVANRYTKTK